MQELASAIAKREQKKVSISIGNVREVLKILAELEAEAKMKVEFPLPLATIREEAKKKFHAMKLKTEKMRAKEKKAKE